MLEKEYYEKKIKKRNEERKKILEHRKKEQRKFNDNLYAKKLNRKAQTINRTQKKPTGREKQ